MAEVHWPPAVPPAVGRLAEPRAWPSSNCRGATAASLLVHGRQARTGGGRVGTRPHWSPAAGAPFFLCSFCWGVGRERRAVGTTGHPRRPLLVEVPVGTAPALAAEFGTAHAGAAAGAIGEGSPPGGGGGPTAVAATAVSAAGVLCVCVEARPWGVTPSPDEASTAHAVKMSAPRRASCLVSYAATPAATRKTQTCMALPSRPVRPAPATDNYSSSSCDPKSSQTATRTPLGQPPPHSYRGPTTARTPTHAAPYSRSARSATARPSGT